MNAFICLTALALCCYTSTVVAFNLQSKSPLMHKNKQVVQMFGNPFEAIPLPISILTVTAVTFAVFNIENKVDLTDQGIAKTRLKKRQDKIARGESVGVVREDLDPYRYKWFEEDDGSDDLELLAAGGKKKTGGCG